MSIPVTDLTGTQIREYWDRADATLKKWAAVSTSTSPDEFQAYREELAEAMGGIERIADMLEAQISDHKRKLGSVKLLLKDISRHSDLAKDKFWQAKRSLPGL